MTTVRDIVAALVSVPDHDATLEVDGLPGRDVHLEDNGRGDVLLCARRRPGADTDDEAGLHWGAEADARGAEQDVRDLLAICGPRAVRCRVCLRYRARGTVCDHCGHDS